MTDLDDLRRTAQDAGRAHEWATLVALAPRLRDDTQWWAPLWGPLCAIGARNLGRPDARGFLDDAIAAGMFQTDILEPELTDAFGQDPDWSAVRAAIAANTPTPPVTLHTFPVVRPTATPTLFRLPPERETALRDRIPEPQPSAWDTACALLAWVTARWKHSSEHTDPDALTILDNVDAGARYACLEYSTVLSQALNARSIPARRISLRQVNAHAGMGTGHVVSEAWIDDLDRWVILDGQNGLYWNDEDGVPLGALDLQARFRAGQQHPAPVFLGTPLTDLALDGWWTYFHQVATNEFTWADPGYVPYFEGAPAASGVLLTDPAQAYPHYADLATRTVVAAGVSAIVATPTHPYATGWRAGDTDLALDEPWPLPVDRPGDHAVPIATRTAYGLLRPSELRFTVA